MQGRSKVGPIISAALLMLILMATCLAYGSDKCLAQSIRVQVDGAYVVFEGQAPYVNSEFRTMVPLRAPMEALGATVEWDDFTSTATITKDAVVVSFVAGQSTYYINNRGMQMDTRAEVINNRVLIPIKYAAEALGAQVSWNEQEQCVVITSSPAEAPVVSSATNDAVSSETDFSAMVDKSLEVEEASFHSAMTVDGKETQSYDCYYTRDKIRLDTDTPKLGMMIQVADRENDVYMVYVSSTNVAALDVLTDEEWDVSYKLAHQQASIFEESCAVYRGTENHNGVEAYVYDYTTPYGEDKIWLRADNGLILEAWGLRDGKEVSCIWKYKQIEGLDDNLFGFPSGVEIIDL